MQSYNKPNKLSKNSHTKYKKKIIDYTEKQLDTLSFLKSMCSYYHKK